MARSARLGACISLVAGVFIASVATVQARGALAIGDCGVSGGSWNYNRDRDARDAVLDKCKGRNCKVVTSFTGLCAAVAIDQSRSCGTWGWATRESRRRAEDTAIRQCENAGGRDCEISF